MEYLEADNADREPFVWTASDAIEAARVARRQDEGISQGSISWPGREVIESA